MSNEFDNDLFVDESEKEGQQEDNKYVTFRIGTEEYGIEIDFVKEIVGIQKVTNVPDMPQYIKGVINLRGEVIPIIDVRIRFRYEEIPYNDRTCIIIIHIGDAVIGLIVDEVSEVMDIPKKNIAPPPKASAKSKNRFIKGIGKIDDNIKILLDVEKIFSDEEMADIESVA
jgi:purine-binding chemotaxis protein CheW